LILIVAQLCKVEAGTPQLFFIKLIFTKFKNRINFYLTLW